MSPRRARAGAALAAPTPVRGTGTAPPPQVAEPQGEVRTRHAPRYRVLLHDDEVTPMDFVCDVLRRIFQKSAADAVATMLEAHTGGVALVEVVPLEIAELHVDQAQGLARTRRYPLTLTIEPAG